MQGVLIFKVIMAAAAIASAWIPAHMLAKKWRRGVMATVAFFIGLITGIAGLSAFSTLVMLALMGAEEFLPAEIIFIAINHLGYILIAALLGALVGWRRARDKAAGVDETAPRAAFDNLKRRQEGD